MLINLFMITQGQKRVNTESGGTLASRVEMEERRGTIA